MTSDETMNNEITKATFVLRSDGDGQECASEINIQDRKNATVQKNKYKSYAECSPIHRSKSGTLSMPHLELPSVVDVALKLNKLAVITPPDAALLNEPPPECESKVLITQITVLPRQKKTFDSLKRKEPKFIPYEPYKACVKPILESRSNKDKQFPNEQNCLPRIPVSDRKKQVNEDSAQVQKFNSVIVDFESEKLQWEETNSRLSDENRCLKKEVSTLKQDFSNLQHQLSVQSQVNNELKKLLVASVGEDVQGRVQCLSEDKARMAAMIRKYSEKVDLDFEEKEKISIECDVWRSKFLASSLLIDELARWKGTLLQKYKEAENALMILLQEGEVSHNALVTSYRHLRQIQDAFDPLHAEAETAHLLTSGDVVSLSVALGHLSENLRNRLLGGLGRAIGNFDVPIPDQCKTPGERMATQVLESHLDPNSFSLTSSSGNALIDRLHPYARSEKLTFNCCGNCDGEIFVV